MAPTPYDLTVKYMAPPSLETKRWWVLRGSDIVSSNAILDVARRTALLMADEDHCTAWLVLDGLETELRGKKFAT